MSDIANKEEILNKVTLIMNAYKKGLLGVEKIPEDSRPLIDSNSMENYHYYTLAMAINFQRNSYKLFESAKATY